MRIPAFPGLRDHGVGTPRPSGFRALLGLAPPTSLLFRELPLASSHGWERLGDFLGVRDSAGSGATEPKLRGLRGSGPCAGDVPLT